VKTKKKTDVACHKTKEQRRAEAIERNNRWAKLTAEQQIERRTQKGYAEGKQMDKLWRRKFDQKKGKNT